MNVRANLLCKRKVRLNNEIIITGISANIWLSFYKDSNFQSLVAQRQRLNKGCAAANNRLVHPGVLVFAAHQIVFLHMDGTIWLAHCQRPVVATAHHDAFDKRLSTHMGTAHESTLVIGRRQFLLILSSYFCFEILFQERTTFAKGSPHVIVPSGHEPRRHGAPASIKMYGAVGRTSSNILCPSSCISH